MIILVVVGVILVSALTWRGLTERAVSKKADSAVAELRQGWRGVDLTDLQRQYVDTATAANDSGDSSKALGLLPETQESDLFLGGFVRGGAFEGSYNVSAGWGGRRCVQIRVVGPAPNRVAFQQHKGEC